MQRTGHIIQVEDISTFKKQLLQWAQQFNVAIWLDSNNYQQKYSNFDAVLAVDAFSEIETSYLNAFSQLKKFQTKTNKTVSTVLERTIGFVAKMDAKWSAAWPAC